MYSIEIWYFLRELKRIKALIIVVLSVDDLHVNGKFGRFFRYEVVL
jgi:hypothetical protein